MCSRDVPAAYTWSFASYFKQLGQQEKLATSSLSTFVLISQNRFSDEADRRAELDLQIGLLAEHELTRVLQMLDAIQDKLGIANDADSELADLEMETRPEDVLAEIDRVHRQVKG